MPRIRCVSLFHHSYSLHHTWFPCWVTEEWSALVRGGYTTASGVSTVLHVCSGSKEDKSLLCNQQVQFLYQPMMTKYVFFLNAREVLAHLNLHLTELFSFSFSLSLFLANYISGIFSTTAYLGCSWASAWWWAHVGGCGRWAYSSNWFIKQGHWWKDLCYKAYPHEQQVWVKKRDTCISCFLWPLHPEKYISQKKFILF